MPPSKLIMIGLDALVASLVERYLAAGYLPNLDALIRRGAYTRAQALFPGVTPINWATIATGAAPGAHGIPDFFVLDPGDPLDGGRDTFDASVYQAETMWQAASRHGLRSATINFPGGLAEQPDGTFSGSHPDQYWIAGRGSPAGISPLALRPTACFASEGLLPELRDAEPLHPDASGAAFSLRPHHDPTGEGPTLHIRPGHDHSGAAGVTVTSYGEETPLAFLRPGQPGPWLWGDFKVNGETKTGSYRLELIRFQPEAPQYAVYVSEVTSPAEIACPAGLGEALAAKHGPFIDYCGGRGYDRGWSSIERMVEEGLYKGLWQANAARTVLEDYDCQAVFLKWHLLDHIEHGIWGYADPLSPWYDPETDQAERQIISAYMAADQMIGALLPLLDEGVTLAITSDHGHIPHLKSVSLNNLLAQHGLIGLQPGEDDPPAVDWARTQAYGGPGLGHLWVNLQGRQPEGTVAPEDYERVRQQVIDLLLGLRDPDGTQPVVKAIRREEARPMGLWGERVGDVVYWMEPGYSGDFNWSPLSRSGEVIVPLGPWIQSFAEYGERKFIAHKFQSLHGCGDPGAALGMGSEETVFVAAGPGIRRGAALDHTPDLACVAPTLAAATGLPRPEQADGEVLGAWVGGG